MAYVKQTWHNTPSTATPIDEDRLNHMEDGIKSIDDAVTAASSAISLEATTRANAITIEANARATAVTNEATARSDADATLQAQITAAASTGALAYAENITGDPTTGPSIGAIIPGLLIVIPANAGEIWIEFGAEFGVTTGGQGEAVISVAEWTGGAFPANPSEWAVVHFDSGQAVTGFSNSAFGKFRLGPTTTDRVFAMGCATTQEGSSLVSYVKNGGGVNLTYAKTWMAAYSR